MMKQFSQSAFKYLKKWKRKRVDGIW